MMARTAARRRLSDDDLYLFAEGTHTRLAEKLGAHPGSDGTSFAVWAPNAASVSVVGDFNGWDRDADPMEPVESSGIWVRHVPDAGTSQVYKLHIRSGVGRYRVDKADPLAFHSETPPKTGSVIWDLAYDWGDEDWLARGGGGGGGPHPPPPRRSRSTRSTSGRGGGTKTAGGSATARSPSRSPSMPLTSASRTSSCSR
jgi:hypothetical protein